MIITVLIVAIVNALSAFVQASTGFGYAIVAMFLMPFVLPYDQCLVISASTIVVIAVQMVVTLRKHIRPKKIIWPMVGCLILLGLGRYLIYLIDDIVASRVMGFFLILLSAFFYTTKKRSITIPANRRNGLLVGFVTGMTTGMFNMVGPFLSLYYYDNFETTLEFKANLECSFLIAGIISFIINMSMYGMDLFMAGAIGLSGAFSVLAGMLGIKIYCRLNKEKLKWIIIIVLPIMGFVKLFNG